MALLAFALIVCISNWSALPWISSRFISGAQGDGGLYIWLVKRGADILTSPWFETNAFYPYSYSLAFTDNFILPALVANLMMLGGASLALSLNILILAANSLNGFVTYKLCRGLTGSARASFIGGLAFMLYPFLSAHYGHTQLQFAFFLPMAALLTLGFISRPSFVNAAKIGFCLFLSFITTVYYALFIALIVPTLIASMMLIRPKYFHWRTLMSLAIGSILGALPALPFILPYLKVKQAFGPRGVFESFYLSATGISYLNAPASSYLYGGLTDRLGHLFLGIHSEAALFPGFLVLVFAAFALTQLADARRLRRSAVVAGLFILGAFLFSFLYFPKSLNLPLGAHRYLAAACLWAGLILAARHIYIVGQRDSELGQNSFNDRSVVAAFAFLFLVFAAISFGPLGNPDRPQAPTQWFGFFRPFYLYFPGYDSLRAVGRAGIPAILGLIVVSAFGLRTFFERRSGSVSVFAALLSAIIVETAAARTPPEAESIRPAIITAIKQAAKPGEAAIFLPFGPKPGEDGARRASLFAALQVNYMLWTSDLNIKLVNGYSGIATRIIKGYPRIMADFPDEKSVAELLSIVGLKHLIYCPSLTANFSQQIFDSSLRQFSDNLLLINKDASGCMLFELRGRLELRKKMYLKMSGRGRGSLSVELMTPTLSAGPALVSVVMPLGPKKPLKTIEKILLPADGSWHKYNLIIPGATASGQLAYIGFEAEENFKLFSRSADFKLEE